MKNLIRVSALLSLLFTFSFTAVAQVEDRWLSDAAGYDRAVQLQRELGIPLIVYFYTDWCPYCHGLQDQYFSTAQVKQYFKGVVRVKINPEHGRLEQQIAEQYSVKGYPSFFVIRKPSSLPANVNPFKVNGVNLTAAQFVSALERGLPSVGLVSSVRISIRPIAPAVKPVPLSAAVSAPKVIPASAPVLTAEQLLLKSILDKYVQAVGGRDAVARINTRVIKGRLDLSGGGSGARFEKYAKAPNMSLTIMKGDFIGLRKLGWDGHTAWVLSDRKGIPDPSAKELAVLADEGDLYRDIKLTELYPQMHVAGRGSVDGRNVYILEATSRFGVADKLYFDTDNGLLMRRDTWRSNVLTEIYFSDWRDVDGVKLAFKITERRPDATYIFTLENVRHNTQLDDEVFRLPSK